MPIPIFAPYTWQETESGVTISARIPGATPANTDFFASPHYVKANSSPGGGSGIFLLEADLLAEIDAKRSAAVVKAGGEVEIRLHKVAPELWGQLTVQALDKAERMRRRRRSIEAAERAAAADAEEAKKAAWEKSRHTLSSQMELDRAYRGVLEARKSAEKAHEEAELDAWQSAHEEARLHELRERYGVVAAAKPTNGAAAPPSRHAQPQPTARPPLKPPKPLPPVRARTTIECTFTPKMTAAPLRTKGSAADYDPEPVPLDAPGLQQGAHGIGPTRARTLKSGDLYDISHRDPAWLKDRGDRFYRLHDFAAAANSYSAVLAQFVDKIPAQAVDTYLACLSNRAACRLQQGELIEAAADATHALALAASGKSISNVPMTDEQLKQRARTRQFRILVRRGAALARLGALEHAAADFELALSDFAPEGGQVDNGCISSPSQLGDAAVRAQLRSDLAAIKERLSTLTQLKMEADAEAAAAAAAAAEVEASITSAGGAHAAPSAAPAADATDVDVDVALNDAPAAYAARARAARALSLYTDALALGAMHVPTLANAAAAALVAGAHARCVSLCDSALHIADAGVVAGAICPVRTRVKLLLRRSTAKCELGHWKGAHADLRRASAFAPSDNRIAMEIRAVCDAARAHGIELGEGGTAALSAISATSSAAIRAHELVSASAAPAEADAASEAASRTAAATGDGAPLSAFALKAHADRAFAAGALEDAVALYGDALRADATAEWERLTDLPLSPPRAADATTCDDAGFVPADGYAGSMPGFVFTTRAGRLGYHRDARARAGVDGAVGSPAAEANARTRAQGEAGSEAEAVTVSGAPADDELHAIIRAAEQPKSGVHLRCLCLSNRAACHLKLGDYARAVDDCTAALAAVRTLTVGDEGMPPTDAVPNAKRDGLLLKLLLRRAAAYVELGRTADALGEYEEAHAIAPDNGAVKDALRQLRARA